MEDERSFRKTKKLRGERETYSGWNEMCAALWWMQQNNVFVSFMAIRCQHINQRDMICLVYYLPGGSTICSKRPWLWHGSPLTSPDEVNNYIKVRVVFFSNLF